MIVCVAEKPSVASEIAKILGARTKKDGYYEGNGYQVTWTFGHLCQLKAPDSYYPQWKRWNMDVLPMIPPKYEVELINNPSIKKQFKVIKDLYKKADSIVNCGDAGQEGELIQRWVMQLAGVRCPVSRLWISSLTEEAIRQGFRNLKPQCDFNPLFEAGLARAEGDWLLGMNATRLYTLKYGGSHQVFSVGRVQTPTLAMIVARDNEIEHFKPRPYWVITTKYRDTVFNCASGRFDDKSDADKIFAQILQSNLIIKDVLQKGGSELPPQLYDLNTLQIDCNRKFGFSADATLKNIQSLYEKKLTTYPRVDTKYLTDDIYGSCPGIIERLAAINEVARPLVNRQLPKSKRVFDSARVTDHHAIIPTGEVRSLSILNDYERKVYDLIVRRFCAAFYPACEYAQTTVLATVASCGFKATGRTILEEGWRACYPKSLQMDENEKEDANGTLPVFKFGESGSHRPSLDQKLTLPPYRFNDASVLSAMESVGIGRPSSRAGIIETLIKRGYVRRDKKSLISCPAGRNLIQVIQDAMLKSPELTAVWESKLRGIEQGHYSLHQFMNELQSQLIEIIKDVKK